MNDTVRTGQVGLRELVLREEPGELTGLDRQRSLLATGLALLATCVALFLVWQTVSSLLIVFAGVLFAAFPDAAAMALAPVLPLNRTWRLTLVLLLLSALMGLGLVWGTGKLPEQTRLLLKVMDTQLDVLQEHLLTALVAMPLGGSLLIWAVVIYTIIQSIEGYVIGPLIQRQAVSTPPAWTLVPIVVLGALFGVMGIALANAADRHRPDRGHPILRRGLPWRRPQADVRQNENRKWVTHERD
jgi:predicted PurR-regulated permease PerM